MYSLIRYIKPISIAIFLWQLTPFSKLAAQNETAYHELNLYRQTIQKESVELYQQALDIYQAKPRETVHYSINKRLCKQYHQLINLSDDTAEQLNYKIEALCILASDAANQQEIGLQLKSLTEAFKLAFWKTPTSYATAFILALEIESLLDNVTDEEYNERCANYFILGEAYYLFNDFERSIDVLKKGTTQQVPTSFSDRSILDSYKIIGICYANLGQIDISDSYFQLILESKDMVLDLPTYKAYALSYLGCNAMLRGEYDKSLILDKEVLPFFLSHTDYGHLAGMYYCRAQCYLAKEDIKQLELVTDSILYFANRDTYNRVKRSKQAFTMLNRYNALIGDALQTKVYSDSLVSIYRAEMKKHTSQYIANAHQFTLNKTIQQVERKADDYRNKLIYSLIIFLAITLTFIYIIYLHRRRQAALKQLVEKNIKLAQHNKEFSNTDIENITQDIETVTEENKILMLRVKQYIMQEKNYRNPNLSLADVSEALEVNRTYLSRAINQTTGDSFKTYINQFRIYEAINIINSNKRFSVSIDALSLRVGFSSRTTFYTNFKKVTGLSPSEFKQNLS